MTEGARATGGVNPWRPPPAAFSTLPGAAPRPEAADVDI